MENEPNLAGTVFAGCKIISKIGQGGMGSVFKAHHEALDKFVCVKLLAPELARDQRNIEFFLREARSAAKLEHPNIVHVYNFGQENGSYFIVMSYVEGKSLQDLVAEKGCLPIKEASEILTGVLHGLAHAHAKSVIHRDIKPANILVGNDGVPRIVDFGLARSITEEKQLTMAGEMVGTAYFMSPEQGLAAKVDARADLYAAGATFFYILTGKYPFDGKSSIEVIHKHISDPVPSIMLINPDVPLWASRVIDQLMRKKPEDRYQSAGQVIEELARHAGRENEAPAVSAETTFDIPEVTARISRTTSMQQASLESAAPPPPPPPAHEAPAPRREEPPPPRPATAAPGEPQQHSRPALQLAGLHHGLKMAVHLALTMAGTACFALAGACGSTPGDLAAPFVQNAGAALALAGGGAALYLWALWQKPYKFTPGYAFFSLLAAACAYAGGALIPAPQGADVVTKGFLAVQQGLTNLFSQANLIVYSLFLYLAASKAVFRGLALKAAAALAYLAGVGMTYLYFKAGANLAPETLWLSVGGLLALLGLAAAFTQRDFSLFFNPQFFFLGANLAMFAVFTNPQVDALTEQKLRLETALAQQANRVNLAAWQQSMLAAQSEVAYDEEGRPLTVAPPPKPAEVLPPARAALKSAARLEYYRSLAERMRGALAESAGFIFIAFFLALLVNAFFIEELLDSFRRQELF